MALETIDLTTDKDTRRASNPVGALYRREAVVDLATVLADESDGTYEAGDILQLIDVNDVVIIGGGIEVLSAATGASVLTLDWDIGAADTYGNGIDGTTVANTSTAVGTATEVIGADTIDLTLKTITGTLTGGLIRCYVWLLDLNGLTKFTN